jgi:putative hydrolase of the HAD superfamily
MKNYLTLFFDLDDTLYKPGTGLWSAIRTRIDQYMLETVGIPVEQIPGMREAFFKKYGTTLRGLQAVYQVNTLDYLQFVHDIPLEKFIQRDNRLQEVLECLPHRKIIFTNADRGHANRVLTILGISQHFDAIVDILDIQPFCKPMSEAYIIAAQKTGVADLSQCLMLDDSLENLKTAASLGMGCIWVNPGESSNHIDCIHLKNLYGLCDLFKKTPIEE